MYPRSACQYFARSSSAFLYWLMTERAVVRTCRDASRLMAPEVASRSTQRPVASDLDLSASVKCRETFFAMPQL